MIVNDAHPQSGKCQIQLTRLVLNRLDQPESIGYRCKPISAGPTYSSRNIQAFYGHDQEQSFDNYILTEAPYHGCYTDKSRFETF